MKCGVKRRATKCSKQYTADATKKGRTCSGGTRAPRGEAWRGGQRALCIAPTPVQKLYGSSLVQEVLGIAPRRG